MGWQVKKLGDVCRIELGKTPSRSNRKYWDETKSGCNVWLSIADLPLSLKPVMIDSKEYITDEGASLCKVVPKDTLIVSFKLSLGRLAFTGRDLFTNEAIAALYINDEMEVNQEYLYWFLTFFDWDAAVGSDIKVKGKTLNKAKLKEIEVLIPSLSEQKRLVAILDEVFADIEQVRAKTEQNLKNARELFESYLQQVFSQRGDGWVKKTLAEVSLDFGRGRSRHRPRNDETLYGGDYPLIQTGDVRNCEHIITNFTKTYNEKGLAQSKIWPKGTICITIAANIAETGILGFDSCFPDSVIGVVVNPEITTVNYVEYLLQSFKVVLKEKGKGAAQDNINMGTFENMKFPFPPLETQNTIVDSLSKLMVYVQQLEKIYLDKLAAIDELKKSILQKAFSGELTQKNNQGAVA